jgi:hypothetical protein
MDGQKLDMPIMPFGYYALITGMPERRRRSAPQTVV